MANYHVLLGVSFWVMGMGPDGAGGVYPSPQLPSREFIPSMPGITPPCVKSPRDTFCIVPNKYPKDRILYLLENNMYDTSSFLRDETRDTYIFETKDMPTPKPMYGYGPPKPPTSYGTSRSPRPPSGYLPPQPPTQQPKYLPPPSIPANSYLPPPPRHSNMSYTRNPEYAKYSRPISQEDSSGPYPRYSSESFSPSTRYSYAIPKEPPKPQPWWKKIMQTVSRQKRQVDSDNFTDLCPSRSSYIMPRAAQTTRGDWMFLVNLNEVSSQYTQLVKSETCIRNRCQGACNVPDGFTAVCQQQYVQKRLVALDGSGSSLCSDIFWFPSCCVCKVRPDGR